MNLKNRAFELVQNDSGHASAATVMRFHDTVDPQTAEYAGPNVTYGHVIVQGNQMLYHAMDASGKLAAGAAKVSLAEHDGTPQMTLEWRWLTGDGANGISVWREISA